MLTITQSRFGPDFDIRFMANNGINPVTQSLQQLAQVPELVLSQIKLGYRIECKLPPITFIQTFNNLLLLFIVLLKVEHGFHPCRMCCVFSFCVLVLLCVKGNLPNTSKVRFAVSDHFRNSSCKVAAFLTLLKAFVYVNYLVKSLTKVAAPHLVLNVFIPDSTIDNKLIFPELLDFFCWLRVQWGLLVLG